jgi:hypothetical protein
VRSTATLRRIVFSPCTKRTFKALSKIEIATKFVVSTAVVVFFWPEGVVFGDW